MPGVIWYTKRCNQKLLNHQANGADITKANSIKRRYSLLKIQKMPATVEPNVLRIPTSLRLCRRDIDEIDTGRHQ